MKVKEMIEQLLKLDQEKETYMFFKTLDGHCVFSSDISLVANGAIIDGYGKLIEGVLVMKEIPRN